MNIDERYALVARNTVEITPEKDLRELLETKKEPVVYLGTAVTGRPHIAYLLWILKLADFSRAQFKVKLLLADLHGALDNTPWDMVENRFEYYKTVLLAAAKAVGADISQFEIVKGSDIQQTPKYFVDVLRMATLASQHDAIKAGSEVVKQSENPKVAGLIYPIMQALDEEYLGVDVQYGGLDQRKILMFAREYLPKLGYKARIEIMTPIIPGLVGEKMSASDPNSKIDLLDAPDVIKKKLNKAHCIEGEVEGNGVLAFIKHVLFILKADRQEAFVIERPEKFGGTLTYTTYDALENDFVAKKVHPLDVKNALAKELSELLAPVRDAVSQELISRAYPE